MTIAEQLQLRAFRILNDGRRQCPAALRWAHAVTRTDPDGPVIPEGVQPDFTLRELSLGVHE